MKDLEMGKLILDFWVKPKHDHLSSYKREVRRSKKRRPWTMEVDVEVIHFKTGEGPTSLEIQKSSNLQKLEQSRKPISPRASRKNYALTFALWN